MTDFDTEAWRAAAQQAVSTVAGEYGHMITRYILVAETMDEDGERAVLMAASPDQRAWDSIGLLGYALQLEQAGTLLEAVEGE